MAAPDAAETAAAAGTAVSGAAVSGAGDAGSGTTPASLSAGVLSAGTTLAFFVPRAANQRLKPLDEKKRNAERRITKNTPLTGPPKKWMLPPVTFSPQLPPRPPPTIVSSLQ